MKGYTGNDARERNCWQGSARHAERAAPARCVLTMVLPMFAMVLAATGHDDHAGLGSMAMSTAADYMSALPDDPVCIHGVGYPMFRSEALANAASALSSSHAMKVGHMDKYTVYMPNGAYPGKIMCSDDDHDHAGHDHGRQLGKHTKCTCPPAGAQTPVVDATKIVNLPMTAFCLEGYYPMYATLSLSNAASPKGTSHHHMHKASDGTMYKFYMPDGVTMVHGTSCAAEYDDQTAALTVGNGPSAAVIGGAIGGSVAGVVLLGALAVLIRLKSRNGKAATKGATASITTTPNPKAAAPESAA